MVQTNLNKFWFSIHFRLRSFCGSMADTVISKNNVLKIRYFAEATALDSDFQILYTAYREKIEC